MDNDNMLFSDFDKRMQRLKRTIKNTRQAKNKASVFQYKPFSKKQKQVLTWWMDVSPMKDKDGIIADGAIRSGKTLSMSLSFGLWAMYNFSDQNFLVCGKTVGSLRRNVVFDFKRQMQAHGYKVHDRRSENMLTISKGSVTNRFHLFGGKDESSQDLVQGITAAGVLFDEVALMPRSFVEQALARCSVTDSRYWFNCNPEHPRHWFYTEWIMKQEQKNALYLHFTMDDNLSLSPRIKARYDALYGGVFYERYIRGKWVIAEGVIYPMFNETEHTLDTTGMRFTRHFISCDYGTLNPASFGLWGESGGKWYRMREYYHDGRKAGKLLTDEEYADALEKLAGSLRIEAVIVDPSAVSFIECIRRRGRFAVLPARNSVLDGIRCVAARLKAGTLLFDRSCKDSIAEFTMYRWDTVKNEDKPIKEHDHAMDDIRYFVYTVLARGSAIEILR